MQTIAPARNSTPTRALLIGFALVAPLLSLALIPSHPLWAIAPLFVSHMLLLWPTLVANSQWWGPVITSFATSEHEVWLTIDDGPSPAHTAKILDLLERFDARATFFVIGQKVEQHPHLVTEILARGHALANHTYTHPRFSFWCGTAASIRREIDRCAETLRTTPERPASFFRAPAGMKNMFVHPALARRDLMLIGWSVRGLDSVKGNAASVADRIEQGARPGAIILLHEGLRIESDPEFTLRCIDLTLQRLTTRGYRCVIPTPSQLRAGA